MRKLEKSNSNRVVSGVLGGLGEYFDIDPTIIRIIFVILAICSTGLPALGIYIVLAIVMPESGRSSKGNDRGSFRDGGYYSNNSNYRTTKKADKRKEAEKVEDNDWSDF